MKKICLLTFAAIFAAVMMSSCSEQEPQYEGPHFDFGLPRIDFGEMEQEEEKSVEVTFKNTGNALLEIKDVRSSCGCTAAVPNDKMIDPGEEGVLKVTFKSGKSQGAVEKVITVTTNDSIKPATKIPVTAFVKTDILLEPRALDFGEVKLGERKTEETRIMSQNGKPFEITFVEADTANFEYTVTPVEEKGNPGYVIAVSLKPSHKPQSFYKVINIRTDNKRMPLHRLSVVANILGNVRIEPRSVLMRGEVGGSDPSRTVSITAVGDATVHVLGIEMTKGEITAKLKKVEEGKNYEIDLTCPLGKPGRKKDYLVIKTDDKFETEVRIPVTVFTAKKNAEEITKQRDSKQPGQ